MTTTKEKVLLAFKELEKKKKKNYSFNSYIENISQLQNYISEDEYKGLCEWIRNEYQNLNNIERTDKAPSVYVCWENWVKDKMNIWKTKPHFSKHIGVFYSIDEVLHIGLVQFLLWNTFFRYGSTCDYYNGEVGKCYFHYKSASGCAAEFKDNYLKALEIAENICKYNNLNGLKESVVLTRGEIIGFVVQKPNTVINDVEANNVF